MMQKSSKDDVYYLDSFWPKYTAVDRQKKLTELVQYMKSLPTAKVCELSAE